MDELPDPILITIFNLVSDIKTLTRSRLVSHRFNSLITQSDSLSLRVDRVISQQPIDSTFLSIFRSLFRSLFRQPIDRSIPTESPKLILRAFEMVKELSIELPGDGVKKRCFEKVRWVAEYGRSLKTMVILGFRCGGVTEVELGGGGGLKTRVVWTISSLISASARHYMVRDIVSENKALGKLVVKDRENEGVLVMNEFGLREFRENEDVEDESSKNEGEGEGEGEGEEGVWWRSNRTRVPAVWMRMRHEAKLELSNGAVMEGATLVVVRPTNVVGGCDGDGWDESLVANRFEGIYGEAVAKLMKRRSYLLEMNSF